MKNFTNFANRRAKRSTISAIASARCQNGSTRPRNAPIDQVMFLRRSALVLVLTAALLPFAAQPANAVTPGTQVDLAGVLSPPPSLSTSGDFATDTFSDPWDFSNPEDVLPIKDVGTALADVQLSGGVLTATMPNTATIRLLMKYPGVLPWGRDGWAHPIDAGRYTQADFSMSTPTALSMAIRFVTASGLSGVLPFQSRPGWNQYHFDLLNRAQYIFAGYDAAWTGSIVWFELFRGGVGEPTYDVSLDWFRLHTANSAAAPQAGIPVPRVISPDIEGGADYATTVRGNPWDMAGMDDVDLTHDVAFLSTASGDLGGLSFANDPWVGLALGPSLNTDRFHRLTVDACYEGSFSLGGGAGEGMVGRVAWMPSRPGRVWTETQDFVVFPGCHRMTIDMSASPAGAVHDEASQIVSGWRGMRPSRLRVDLNEDPGLRNFSLRDVRLADDAAFATSYPITFADTAGAANSKADIYVTTTQGSYSGTQIATNFPVVDGVNTFNWNGTDVTGAGMPNGTYWVYIVMHNASGSGVGYATGPLRLEKPVPQTPSYFVPLTPSRLLDTRTGEGGNIVPLDTGVFTELNVRGVGGLPATGVEAVVLNVTVTSPTLPGYITAWPSGEPQPVVSNLNFEPGQTVPNLVTVKIGANGKVNLFNSAGQTDLVADVAGYYTATPPPTGGRFTAVTPARLLDTRDGTGAGGNIAPLGQGQSVNLTVLGAGGVPASGVSGVALNVTVDQPTRSGFLTVWPAGEGRPTASTHNFVPGLTVANMVLAKVGVGGQISIFNNAGETHVVADVIGYFSRSGGLFVPISPQRMIDTRSGIGVAAAPIGASSSVNMSLITNSPVPSSARAVVLNVTSVNSTELSFVTVWPAGVAMPLASTLNPRPSVPVPNQAYLLLGSGGSIGAFNNSGTTDLIVDVFGYVSQ